MILLSLSYIINFCPLLNHLQSFSPILKTFSLTHSPHQPPSHFFGAKWQVVYTCYFHFLPYGFSLKPITVKLSPYHSSKSGLVKWWLHLFPFLANSSTELSIFTVSNFLPPIPFKTYSDLHHFCCKIHWSTLVLPGLSAPHHTVEHFPLYIWLSAYCTFSDSLLLHWSFLSLLLVLPLLPDLVILEASGLGLSLLTSLVISASSNYSFKYHVCWLFPNMYPHPRPLLCSKVLIPTWYLNSVVQQSSQT